MKFSLKPIILSTLQAVSFSSAQAQQLPIVGDLLGSGLPLGESLSSISFGLNSLTAAPFLNSPLESLLSLSTLGASVLGNPTVLFSVVQGTGLPLAQDIVPVLGALTTDPASLPSFILGEGSLLTPTLSVLPSIPLVTMPLGLGL